MGMASPLNWTDLAGGTRGAERAQVSHREGAPLQHAQEFGSDCAGRAHDSDVIAFSD